MPVDRDSVRYTLLFAGTVCLVCALVVSTSVVMLRDRQAQNQKVDRLARVLEVAGLVELDEKLAATEVLTRFEQRVRARVVALADGQENQQIDPLAFNQRRAAQDAQTSRPAPPNDARVLRLPKHGLVYEVLDGDKISKLVLPIQGYGLWSTMYGYLALEGDGSTVAGIAFYEHAETPGLGGEIDNPRWRSSWEGRKLYDAQGKLALRVAKGPVGDDPNRVEAISGATITSRGVSHAIALWLGPDGFGPYLDDYRAQRDPP